MKRLIGLFAMTGMLFIMGCNTMEGAGKDIERGGQKMEGAAENTKQKM